MHEGPAWHRHAGPSCALPCESAHRLPLQLRGDLLPAIVDLRRLAQILAIGLEPLLADLLYACRAELLLLRLEVDAVGRLPGIDPKHVHGITRANGLAHRSNWQCERYAARLADRAACARGPAAV